METWSQDEALRVLPDITQHHWLDSRCPVPNTTTRQMGNSWCLDSLVRTGTAFLSHQECHQSHLVPMGVMGHSGPLPVPGTQVGRSLDGALGAGKRVRQGLAAPRHHPCIVCPSKTIVSCSFPKDLGRGPPASQQEVPSLGQPHSYPGALFPRPHPCIRFDFEPDLLPVAAPSLQPHIPLQWILSQLQRYSYRWCLSFLKRVSWVYIVGTG